MTAKKEYSWHHDQWSQVNKQIEQTRLASAYLLSGQAGLGKYEFALQLAAALLCESNADLAAKPCGECKQCLLLESGFHPDLKICSPEEKSKVVKIDQIREQVAFLEKSSLQGGRKISIITPADSMNINAANALLKTLEEPTANSLLILITNQASQLLPTIRSRCQELKFVIPEYDVAVEWLRSNNPELSVEHATQLIEMAGGAPLLAQQWVESGYSEIASQSLKDLGAVLKRERSVCDVAKNWAETDLLRMLQLMLYWQQQLIQLKMTNGHAGLGDPYAQKMFEFISGRNTATALFELYQETLVQYELESKGRNPNKQLLLESLLVRWLALMP